MPRQGPVSEVTAIGGRAVIRLPETPTSGYVWELAEAPDSTRVVGDHYQQEHSTRVAGGGGERVLEVEVRAEASVELVFELRRPWESEPLERRQVVVRNEP